MRFKKQLAAVATFALMGASQAQAIDAPKVFAYNGNEGVYITAVSDNGRYAVFTGTLTEDTQFFDNPVLVDLKTGKSINLKNKDMATGGAFDVSDDGLVVGVYGTAESPMDAAYYTPEGEWKKLSLPRGKFEGSKALSVTPDGKYACGFGFNYSGENFIEVPIVWDLTSGKIIECNNMPEFDLAGDPTDQVRLLHISPDGKYVIGQAAFSYVNDTYAFLYDIEAQSFKPLGFELEGKKFSPAIEMIHHSEDACFSPNGKYIIGDCYIVEHSADTFGTEYFAPYTYNVATGEYKLYNADDEIGTRAGAISNEGVPYVSAPYESPIRAWSVYADGYWVSFEQILKQIYGTTIGSLTKYSDVTTGTIIGLDSSSTVVGAMILASTGESYVVTLPEDPVTSARKIDLLADYQVTPAPGSQLSGLKEFSIRFSRNIEVAGKATDVSIKDEGGNVVANSIKISTNAVNPAIVTVSFRGSVALENGKTYTVEVPEGTLQIQGDDTRKNKAISFEYIGREAKPVSVVSVAPQPGIAMAQFDSSSNPISITFDTNIQVEDNYGELYEEGQDGSQDVLKSTLGLMAAGNQLMVYPTSMQYLYAGSKYRIVIPAGAVADVTGENPNEEIVLEYEGAYEREIPDGAIFKEDFNDGRWLTNFMFYEGDHNMPNAEMQSWGFDESEEGSFPWWIVRDSEDDTDWAFCSHSMYTPAGQSDDWAITPQLYIPDASCALTFQASSYLKSKADHLKVYALVSDAVHNAVSEEFVNEIRNKGIVIFDEQLKANGGKLAGNWVDYAVVLSEFAGKSIYLAFVNDNNDQSAIFLDNVMVEHYTNFAISFENDLAPVAATSSKIYGKLRVEDAEGTYTDIAMTLKDENGNQLDEIKSSGLNLKYGDIYEFAFTKELPLKKGAVNKFTVDVKANDAASSFAGAISNLYFMPEKHVVIEEMTGTTCSNCPLGIIMMDRLHEAYGDKVIPVAIHTYDGDALGTGMQPYSSYLGLSAAPSAQINRDGNIYFPMASGADGYMYTNPESPLWWDAVANEFATPASASIDNEDYDQTVTKPVYNPDNNTFYVHFTVRYALDATNVNDKVLVVVLENGLKGVQTNGFAAVTDPLLGEWGKGGANGQQYVVSINDHVARDVIGTTFAGTSGMIPATVNGGQRYTNRFEFEPASTIEDINNVQIVTMLINGNTNKVINAVCNPIVMGTGVDDIVSDLTSADVNVRVEGSDIIVTTVGDVEATAYTTNGQVLAIAEGNGNVRLNAGSYRGVAIVRTVTAQGADVRKVVVK